MTKTKNDHQSAAARALRDAASDVFDTSMPAEFARWLEDRADEIDRAALPTETPDGVRTWLQFLCALTGHRQPETSNIPRKPDGSLGWARCARCRVVL